MQVPLDIELQGVFFLRVGLQPQTRPDDPSLSASGSWVVADFDCRRQHLARTTPQGRLSHRLNCGSPTARG